MSRLAVHQGSHVHPPRNVFLRKSIETAEEVLEKHHNANPSATPSRLRNVSIGDILAQINNYSATGLTQEDKEEIWEALQVISTPSKFMSLLRSVRKDS